MRNLKTHFRGGLLVGAVALSMSSLVAGNVAMIAAPTPAYAASKKSVKKSKDDSLKGIKVKKSVDKYTWSELARISDAMTQSGSRKAAVKIAKKYKLCNEDGKLDGSQVKKMTTTAGEASVRIVDFYHDNLSNGSGKSGITWQFVNGMCAIEYGADNSSSSAELKSKDNQLRDSALRDLTTDSWLPSDVVSRLATVSVKTAGADSIKSGEATSADVKMWAPSATEVLGNAKKMTGLNRDSEWMANALNAEGTQYELFRDQGLSWKDQSGAFSDYPTSYLYEYGYTVDSYEDTSVGPFSIYDHLKDSATPQIFEANKTPKLGCISVYRSLYVNPKTPDATIGEMAASTGQSSVSSCGRYTDLGTGIDKVIQPLFCLTANDDDASGAAESNGVAIQDSVDNYSWKNLKVIADEIATAKDDDSATAIAKKYHLVGDDGYPNSACYKIVKLSTGTEVKAYIVGFNHDDRADGKGKAGITFMVGGAPVLDACVNSDGANSGGWKDSDIRKTLNKKVLASMPKDLRKSIVKVTKLTNNTGVTTDASAVTSTEDSLWLPSMTELFFKDELEESIGSDHSDTFGVYEAEGSLYDVWHKTDDTAWTRSCDASESGSFQVYKGIKPYGTSESSKAYGIYPGFCL